MKILKAISTFLLFSILFGSCFDPPTFPITPYIESPTWRFVEAATFLDKDSLILTFRFQDGDGDLGLPDSEIDDPFNRLNFFLVNSSGGLEKIGTESPYTNIPPLITPKPGQTGKLASVRTLTYKDENGNTQSLPPYTIPYSCINYTYDSLYIREEHKDIFDDSFNLYKVLQSTNPILPTLYVLLDTLYTEINPYYHNITVDFLIKQNDGTFKEFDWVTEFCNADNKPGITQDGRFPKLAEKSGPLEGTLQYSMVSSGFLALFSVKTMRLRIQVFDRALHPSNVILTEEFTLR